MEFIAFNHNFFLVTMSCIVAIVAGFTGLSLTRNLSNKSVPEKAISVTLAVVALGGGIWSMHFVAMLGLRLPVLFYYCLLYTSPSPRHGLLSRTSSSA